MYSLLVVIHTANINPGGVWLPEQKTRGMAGRGSIYCQFTIRKSTYIFLLFNIFLTFQKMALSLLQGYDSDRGSGSSSDSDDDITVTINQDTVQGKKKRYAANNHRNQPIMKKIKQEPTQRVKTSQRHIEGKSVPLPASINAMFNEDNVEIVHDDPTLHDGRIRSFGHEPNNWATYVYVDLQDCELDEVKNFIVKELDLEPIEHHHLSVSRVVSFRHHWIDPFIQSVKSQMEHSRTFFLSLDKLQVYANDDRTRTFVGLEASVGVKELQKLTYTVDKCFKEYNLPSFYYPPSFHVSLGWCLGDMRAFIRQKLQKTELKLVDILDDDDDIGRLVVKNINIKSGNKIFEVKLKQ